MDPNLALIVAALSTGVAKLAEPAVRDAYEALKNLIVNRFGSKPDVASTVGRMERNPEAWTEALKEVLAEAGVDKDVDVVQAASRLRSALAAVEGTSTLAPTQIGDDNVQQTINSVSGGNVIGRVGRETKSGE